MPYTKERCDAPNTNASWANNSTSWQLYMCLQMLFRCMAVQDITYYVA